MSMSHIPQVILILCPSSHLYTSACLHILFTSFLLLFFPPDHAVPRPDSLLTFYHAAGEKKIPVCRFQCAARAFSVNDQDTCSHPRESSPALLSIDKRSTLNVGDANNEALSEGFVCCAFLTGTSMATLLCARSRHGRRPRPSLWLVDWQDRQRTTRDGRSSKTGLM